MRPWGIGLLIVALAEGVSFAAADSRSDEFYDAIRSNNLARLEMLVRGGADVNSKVGETAVDWATKVGAPSGIEILRAERAQQPALPVIVAAPMEVRTPVEHSVALLEKSSQGVAYQLVGLAAAGHRPDRLTDAMAANLAASQRADGSWHTGLHARPGGEDGDIFRTALGIRSLKVYGPPGRVTEMEARVAKDCSACPGPAWTPAG